MVVLLTAGLVTPSVAAAEGAPAVLGPVANARALGGADSAEKLKVLGEMGMLGDASRLLPLSDCSFVTEVGQRALAVGKKAVSETARLAWADGESACTRWIQELFFHALRSDQENEWGTLTLKQHAAEVVGLNATPQMLALGVKNFVFEVYNWAVSSGQSRVKAAALTAYRGASADQLTFLDVGVVEAHNQDVQDKIDQDDQKDQEQKALEKSRAAKRNALTVVRAQPTDELANLPDQQFISEIVRRAERDTNVYATALTAVLSEDAAVWKEFINAGIYRARDADLRRDAQQRAEADRRRVLEIRTKAAQSLVHPALVAAADSALAGGPAEVGNFLLYGQFQSLSQSFESGKQGKRGRYLNGNGSGVWLGPNKPGSAGNVTWTIRPGLANPDCHSFEMSGSLNFFLVPDGGSLSPNGNPLSSSVSVSPSDDSDAFRRKATWCVEKRSADTLAFKSAAYPNYYLRQQQDSSVGLGRSGPRCEATEPSRPGQIPPEICLPMWNPDNFAAETAWRIAVPNPPDTSSEITQRWLNDDALRARAGEPVDAEQADGSVRWRDYQHARLYWRQDTGVHEVRENILDAYLKRFGGHQFANFGPPVTDQSVTPDGIGRYNHFVNGGSIYWTQATGAYGVWGAIRTKWAEMGWERSFLGYPTSDEYAIPEGRRSTFQGGWIDWIAATGKIMVCAGSPGQSASCRPPA
ncbi:AbfB domain-containing protein [Amycolatopsis dendrobii]|uniref:AbfB domain-containing protein n=1 Tax=Amycolatopsis dendrobii TaxID=2760662 RepID=A0A7W3W3P6_9PSEU|nr:AbfB domain-containing protein [Amycolatopsis dendrobii]MBB1157682.1 AbfB domain-containing protein [Amycolatopsis dendrobii]